MMKRMLVVAATLTVLVGAAGAAMAQAPAGAKPTASSAFVWIEGETVEKTNVPVHGWLKGDNLKMLSGGDALTGMAKPTALPSPCFITYTFDSPADGTFDLYIRHGYMASLGAMRYRFVKLGADGQPSRKMGDEEGWLKFDQDATTLDRQQIGQFRTIGWTKQQQVPLEKASYQLDVQVTGPNPGRASDPAADVWIAIDAICLTKEPFTPSGILKPGEKPGDKPGATSAAAKPASPPAPLQSPAAAAAAQAAANPGGK